MYKDPFINQPDEAVFHGSCHMVGCVSTAHMGAVFLVGNPNLNCEKKCRCYWVGGRSKEDLKKFMLLFSGLIFGVDHMGV